MFSTLFLLTSIASVMYVASAMILVSFFDARSALRERERQTDRQTRQTRQRVILCVCRGDGGYNKGKETKRSGSE